MWVLYYITNKNKNMSEQKMTDNLVLILKEFEELKGQFVITCSHEIERLVAVGDDEMDYYWITYNGRNIVWNTCVGRIIPLKGYLREEDYNEFIRLAKLNHYDQLNKEKFLESLSGEIKDYSDNHYFLTDFCWELV